MQGVFYSRALELSTQQASLSWALRAATSLAVAENSTGQKGGRVADPANHPREISEAFGPIYDWPSRC